MNDDIIKIIMEMEGYMGEQKNTKEKESKREKDFVENIIGNYRELEKSIVCQLKLHNECHPTTTGS